MAAAITKLSSKSAYQAKVIAAITIAHAAPFKPATPSSLTNNQRLLDSLMCPRARLRITSVRVCVPATPPILATMGMSTAR